MKHGWKIISGGTDSHLVLVDTWMGGLKNELGAGAVSGSDASDSLEKVGIIVNKNTIPGESRSAFDHQEFDWVLRLKRRGERRKRILRKLLKKFMRR